MIEGIDFLRLVLRGKVQRRKDGGVGGDGGANARASGGAGGTGGGRVEDERLGEET